jgi:hypothetical protein
VTARRWMRFALILSALTLIAAVPAADVASAHKLSRKRAVKAAYKLTNKLAVQDGAQYAFAGRCKRLSAHRFRCWGAIVWTDYNGYDYYGAAERIRVRLKGGKVRARRYGHVYSGPIGDTGASTGSSEWAICGIHQSVCIGS